MLFMKNQLVIILLLLFSTSIIAQSSYLNIDSIIKAKTTANDSNRPDDIGYLYTTPQYEENQDPNKAVVVEYYFGEYDGTPESLRKLEFIKEIINDDKKSSPNYSTEFLSISSNVQKSKEDHGIQNIINKLSLSDSTKKFEQIPETIFFNPESYNERKPNSFSPGRKFWTFARFAAGAAPTFAALTVVEGLAPGIAASVAFWPGAASGAITYFNGSYGKFITNGSWAKWVLESDKKFAKILRRSMGLTPPNFEKHLLKNKKLLSKRRPELFKNDPKLFEKKVLEVTQEVVEKRKSKILHIAKKLTLADEYVKWFATEIAFTSFALKMPQAVAGLSTSTSFIGAASDVLSGSMFGMLAQGPGDIAIQKRKMQKIDELYEQVKAGKKIVDSKDELLAEIKKIKNPKAHAIIGQNSHKALKRIENWARSRATMLSFFSVTGVGMELMGIPLARPILIATGIGGAAYYGNVSGWLSKDKLKKVFTTNYVKKLKATNFFTVSGLKYRLCSGKFKYKPF